MDNISMETKSDLPQEVVGPEKQDNWNETMRATTVWIPIEYKEKFALLQSRTKKGFSKKMRELFKRAIDDELKSQKT